MATGFSPQSPWVVAQFPIVKQKLSTSASFPSTLLRDIAVKTTNALTVTSLSVSCIPRRSGNDTLRETSIRGAQLEFTAIAAAKRAFVRLNVQKQSDSCAFSLFYLALSWC